MTQPSPTIALTISGITWIFALYARVTKETVFGQN
jgi:hypothetical protein